MNSERELQRRVLDELEWEPAVKAVHIGVAVTDGVVTLTGNVESYIEKVAAERAAKRVGGVQVVANDLEVRPPTPLRRNDTEIGGAVRDALEWDVRIPHDKIKARVADAAVTLEGTVPFQYQRAAAESAIRRLSGIKAVYNLIGIEPAVVPAEVKGRIEAAFRRSAEIDAGNIQVDVADSKVVLRGNVRSWAEREEAERAAWSAPGVRNVQDELKVKV
jgi:osmotically-inducible protein OsmY